MFASHLAILGYVMILFMFYALLSGKFNPMIAFIVLPPIFGVLAGASISDIGSYVHSGVSATLSSSAMALFAGTYFAIMTELGLFDPPVNFLAKKAGGNVTLIMIFTVLIASCTHLDTGMTSTVLITIPSLLPLYKRFGIRRQWLFLLLAQCVAIINSLPHSGAILRVTSVVTDLDASTIFHQMLPVILICCVFNLVCAVVYSRIEMRYMAKHPNEEMIEAENAGDGTEGHQAQEVQLNAKYWANAIITICALAAVFMDIMKTYFIFMVALSLVLLVNYKGLKAQNAVLKKNAGSSFNIALTMLSSGVLVGILGQTGMLDAMAAVVINIIPDALSRVYPVLVGIISLPLGMCLGADGYFYGMTPLFTQVGEAYGFSHLSIACVMLLARDVFSAICPVSAVTYMAPGLLGLELKDLIKFSVPFLFIMYLFELIVLYATGAVPLL